MRDYGMVIWDDRPTFQHGQEIRLFLDDERSPPDDSWVLVRHGWQAEIILHDQVRLGYRVIALSLDHDLGDESFGTGYDVASWLEGEVVHGRVPCPQTLLCHSANPVGRMRIEQAFASIRRFGEFAS